MKKILQKCTKEDFEYLSEVLDSYVAFTNDSKRKKLLAQYPQSKNELIDLVDKQIRYYGSSDMAYIWRAFSSNDAGVSADELISDVAQKMKVKIKLGASVEKSLEILATSVVEKELHDKTPEELREYFKKIGIGDADTEQILDFMKQNGPVGVIPILLKVLGPELTFAIVQNIIIGLLAIIIGKEAAKQLLKELAKKLPAGFAVPFLWIAGTGWLAFDLQGEAYRKTVPICLYLGIVALSDGEEPE